MGAEFAAPIISGLTQLGVAGAVLAWFMFTTGPKLDAIERAIDRMTRAMLVDVLSRPGTPQHVATQASEILKELDNAQARRPGTPL